MIREINYDDFKGLLTLYTQLHNNPFPQESNEVIKIWNQINEDENYHIIVAEEDGKIISSCSCIIIPNLTHSLRPYALIENVIIDINYRSRGYASMCLAYAERIARHESCYKMMLMTGSKLESTLKFYKSAGYNQNDKTAFIMWL